MISQLSQMYGKSLSDTPKDGGFRNSEETLVVDSRASLRPAQVVEQKLASLLKSVPCSQVRMSALLRSRGTVGARL